MALKPWKVKLIGNSNTHICELTNLKNESNEYRLEIRTDDSNDDTVEVIIKADANDIIRIKSIRMQGQTVEFKKDEDNVLVPKNVKQGDTWSVSARKSTMFVTITVNMGLEVKETTENIATVATGIEVKATALFTTQAHAKIRAILSLKTNDGNYEPEKIEITAPHKDVLVKG